MKRASSRVLALLATAALVAPACAVALDTDDTAALRAAFPKTSPEALDHGARFDAQAGALVAAARSPGNSPGTSRLSLEVGERGHVRVRDVEGGFGVQVREIGARGAPERAEHTASYEREGGRSYWSNGESGAEEWLAVAAPGEGPVATWEIEGARLHPVEGAIELVDDAGTARLRVSAPAAYGHGERALPARLVASGARLELFVDGARPGERLLVDPKYEPVWIVAANVFGPRVLHAMTSLPDGEVVIYNGYAGNAPVNDTEVYDPSSNRWRQPFSLQQKRAAPTATTLQDGRVLVVGGNDGSGFINGTAGIILASVEISDPLANVAPLGVTELHVGREFHSATLLADGRVLVVGGYNGSSVIASFEVYDPRHDTWTLGAMARGYVQHTETLLGDGRVLVVAGTADVFDPATNAFTAAPNPPQGRVLHTATLLLNGQVLVTGGSLGGNSSSFASASLYDPRANHWTATAAMGTARQQHTATRLADGRVLVAGGLESFGGHALTTTEIYDPATSTWTPGPSMHDGRIGHTAALLPGGQVIVVAGANLSINGGIPNTADLSSVELYSPYLRDLGEPCGAPTACGSGFCVDGVCCDTACNDSSCQVCSAAAGAAVNGTCVKLDPDACKAHPCTTDGECGTHHCADGVCCDKKCDGMCETCGVVRGTCTAALEGTDPRGDCRTTGSAVVCGPTCDGHGACIQSVAGTPCVPASCSDETHAVGAVLCEDIDGGLACSTGDAGVTDCAPFKCDPLSGACKESCTSVRDCPEGYVCTPKGSCERRPDETAEDDTGCSVGRGLAPSGSNTASVIALALALGALASVRRRRQSPS